MASLQVEQTPIGVRFEVRVAPRASRTAVVGVHDGALKVALSAPPVEGAANAALVKLLAKRLGVPKRAIRLARGEQGRRKRIEVAGIRVQDVADLAGYGS